MLSRFRQFLENDPQLYGHPIGDPDTAGRLRAEQVRWLLRYTPYMLMANVLTAIILLLSFADGPLRGASAVFSTSLCAIIALYYASWRTIRGRPQRITVSVRAPRQATVKAVSLGLLWALPPIFFISHEDPSTNVIIASLSIGMMCGGAFALSAVPAAALGFVAPIAIGCVVGVQLHSIDQGNALVALLLVFLFVIVKSSLALASMLTERLLGQFAEEKQSETISLLLGEFEENASDWLWETNAAGELIYASPSFYKAMGDDLRQDARPLVFDLLRRHLYRDEDAISSLVQMKSLWTAHRPFREIAFGLDTQRGRRWCLLTGRPLFDPTGAFRGYRGFCADVTERREHEARISHLARHDSVTGLPNRLKFGERLAEAIEQTSNGSAAALFYIDLDGFKEVNDTFGHAIGDKLLQTVSERLVHCAGSQDQVARLGGDEFAVLQAGSCASDTSSFAEWLIADLSRPYEIGGFAININASIGIVCIPQHGAEAERLLIHADLALYRAKAAGKGTWRLFEEYMDEEARARRALEDDLRAAIANGGFRLVFQPLVSLADGRVPGYEALLRWRHPARGDVPPSEFIPLAEETGLIFAIGEWVIDEACRIAAQWPEHLSVAVNLSPAQFHSQGLLPSVRRALSQHGLAPSRLEIEITESVLVSNVDRVQLILGALSAMGVRIALDDFGTGYSSLGYIRQIKFDKIKIDRSFVQELSTDRKCAAIVRAVLSLARELGMRVTAEGVETSVQFELLRREGCTEAQGYFISPPLEAEDAMAFQSDSAREQNTAAA